MSTYNFLLLDIKEQIKAVKKNLEFLVPYAEGYDTEENHLSSTIDNLAKAEESITQLNEYLKPERKNLELT